MAKDFIDTQTGGQGATSQVGDKPTEDAGIKRPPGRPTSLVDTGGEDDDKKKKKKKKKNNKDVVSVDEQTEATLAEAIQPVSPSISGTEEDLLSENGMFSDGVEEIEDVPLIANVPGLQAQEEALEAPSFSFPSQSEDLIDDEEDYIPFSTPSAPDAALDSSGYPLPDYSTEPTGEPIFPVNEADEKPAEIYTYGENEQKYASDGDKWYEKKDPKGNWTPVSDVGRVYGLNASARDSKGNTIARKVPVPKTNYNPPSGGTDIEGVRVYGYKSHPGEAYIIEDGQWLSLKKGGSEWKIINDDSRIKALNRFHGTDTETTKQRVERIGASLSPSTSVSDDKPKLFLHKGKVGTWGTWNGNMTFRPISKYMSDSEIEEGKKSGLIGYEGDGRNAPSLGGIEKDLDRKVKKEERDRIFKAFGDVATQAGEITGAAGHTRASIDADVPTDDRNIAIRQRKNSSDELFEAPFANPKLATFNDPTGVNASILDRRKKTPIGIVTNKLVKKAEENRDNVVSDIEVLKYEKGLVEGTMEYDDFMEEKQPLIDAAEQEVVQAEISTDYDKETSRIRRDYLGSDEYVVPEKSYEELRDRVASKSYGMYQDNAAEELIKDREEIAKINLEENQELLDNFASADLESWNERGGNLSDEQMEDLKEMQHSLSKSPIWTPLMGWEIIDDIKNFISTSADINNEMALAYDRGEDLTTLVLENKKVLFEESKHLLTPQVVNTFKATMKMVEFLSIYVDSGKVTIDKITGRYDISDKVGDIERAKIEETLKGLIENYQDVKSNLYSENMDEVMAKQSEIRGLEAAIANFNRVIKANGGTLDELGARSIDDISLKIIELRNDIREIQGNENTVLLNDPNAIVSRVASSSTASSRHIMKALPSNITPKQKFDLFYENLTKKNEELAEKHDISQSYWDRTGEKLRDVLDWEYLGYDLEPYEIEFYKNAATLQQTSSLYFNNDWGITEESAGFWESFHNSLISTFAPVTSGANGYYNETTIAASEARALQQQGFTEEDFADGMTYDKLFDRMDVDFLTFESAGSMLGATSAMMFAMVASGPAGTGLIKLGKGVTNLMKKYEKLDNVTDFVADLKRVEQAYQKTMKASKLGRFINQTATQGAKMQWSGMVFNQDDQLNFASGMGGAIAGKGFEAVFRKMPPSQVVAWIGGFFGSNTDRAVAMIKRMGQQTTTLRAAHYRGLGEMPEEFAQELIQIYNDELRTRGFWDEVGVRYGKLSDLGELLAASYILGAGIGTVMSSTQQDIIDTLPPGELAVIQEIAREGLSSMANANADADIAAERIVNNEEARNSVKDTKNKKPTIDSETKEEDGPKGRIYGKLVYEDGKLGVWSNWNGEPLFTENTRMSQTEIADGISSGTIIDVDSEAKVEDEVVTPESTDVSEETITLADKIRSRKIDTKDESEYEAEEVVNNSEDAVSLLKKGYLPIIDGELNPATEEEISKMASDGDLNMVLVRPMAAGSVIPKVIWNTAVEAVALTVEVGAVTIDTIGDITDSIKNSKWYTGIAESNPEEAKKIRDQLDKIELDLIDTGVEYKAPKTPSSDLQLLKNKIATFKKGRQSGNKKGKKDTRKEFEAKKAEVEAIQKELISYYKDNLPNEALTKKEAGVIAKSISEARTMKGLGDAINAIDNQVNKFNELARKKAADEVISTFNDPLTKARGNKKVSKISKESRKELSAIAEEVGIDNIADMTKEELDALSERIDAVITTGAESVKAKEKAKQDKKSKNRKIPFEILAEQNNTKIEKVSGEEAIEAILSSKQGYIIIGDNMFTSKTKLREHLADTGTSYDEIGEVNAVMVRATTKDSQRRYQERLDGYKKAKAEDDAKKKTEGWFKRNIVKSIPRAVRKARTKSLNTLLRVGGTLDNRLMDVYKGSKELRVWVKENISDLKETAKQDRDNARLQKLSNLRDGMQKIFGKDLFSGIPKTWNNKSGMTIFKVPVDLTKGQVVRVAQMLYYEPSMIYEVDGKLYDSKSKVEELINKSLPITKGMSKEGRAEINEARKSALKDSELTDKYNPKVLQQISEEIGLDGGLDKAKEIEKFMDDNPKLKAANELFLQLYQDSKSEYASTFEDLYGLEFKEGYYVPGKRDVGSQLDTDILSGPQFKSAQGAMSNNLKKRYHGSNAAFDFTTDAYSVALDYINTMEHAKHFLPVAEGVRDLMNDVTKSQIIEKIGIKETIELSNHLDRVLSDGASSPIEQNAVTKLASFTVFTTLAAKLGSIPKQLTSATHYLGAGLEYGVGSLSIAAQFSRFPAIAAGAVGEKITGKSSDSSGSFDALSENEMELVSKIFGDAFVVNRLSGKDIDTETRNLANDIMASKGKNAWRQLRRALMSPTIIGDMGGVLTGGIPFTLALYNEFTVNQNMSHEEAMKKAISAFVSISNRTQQSQDEAIVSNAQRDPVYRMFLMYTTSQVAAMSELTKAGKILVDTKGGYTGKEKVRAARKFGYYMVANSVFQLVSSGAYGMYLLGSDDDDDDSKEEKQRKEDLRRGAFYNVILDTVSSNLQGFGLPGKVFDMGLNKARGRDVFNNVPVVEKLVSIGEVGSEYAALVYDATRLYADGDINPEEFLYILEKGSSQKLDNTANKLIGVKNFIDIWESGAAWNKQKEGEGEQMDFFDFMMNRTPDEEGKLYKTPREHKDELYIRNWPVTPTNWGGLPDDVLNEMGSKESFGSQKDFDDPSSMFADAPLGNVDRSTGLPEDEEKKRTRPELLEMIKTRRINEELSPLRREDEGRFVSPSSTLTKDEEIIEESRIRKEERDNTKEEMIAAKKLYKERFGEDAPSATISEIRKAWIDRKKL